VFFIAITILCGSSLDAQEKLAVSDNSRLKIINETLLFDDDFERRESQEVIDEPGNGWSTNSDKRAGGNKQVDLVDGVLHVDRHQTADHSVSIVHPANYKDCRVELKFQLDDQADDIGIDFADMQCKEVHAGHICKVFFRADGVEMQDLKSGRMNKAFRDAVKLGTATDEQKADVKNFRTKFDYPIKLQEWHTAIVTIIGDTISVQLDGEDIGSFASSGMDHPQKDLIRFSASRQVRLDDVRMFAINTPKTGVNSSDAPVKHLFVAKLLWRRMESVNVTPEQVSKFNQLSGALRTRIDKIRAEAGITQDTIKRRDEVYSELKKTPLKGDELYRELQKRGGFTDPQRDAFRETQEHYATFKSAVLNLLTKEQRARLPKPGKRK
tara:strand:- start:23290 stop:24435 length:1146 start_codon:yes stop_codon:yes gene_type:complete